MKDVINSSQEVQILLFSLPKLLVATICGLIIGYDREVKGKVAGIRTNILICAGSTIFTLTSVILGQLSTSDPSRILSTIVTGTGFLGAGLIMKNENTITGITTSAFIWVISAIGILCGLGSIITPIALSIGLVITTKLFEKVEKRIKEKNNPK